MDSIKHSSTKQSVYDLVTTKIISLLEKGVIPWKQPWIEAGIPQNLFSKRPYRGVNLLLLNSLSYERNLYLTFNQVRKIGGTVRRGEHGHIVVYYTVKKSKETGEHEEEETKRKILLRHFVFNVSQVALPESFVIPMVERQNDPITACERIVNECPKPLVITHLKPQAYYSPTLDYINMPPKNTFISSESYYDALFHELCHFSGHSSRLNRPGVADRTRTDESYSFEELIAQLGASFLSNHAGILPPVIDNSAAYIAGWLNVLRNDKRMILRASAAAQRAADFILNRKDDEEESESLIVPHSSSTLKSSSNEPQ
jgi:antirestriction protein ArdC